MFYSEQNYMLINHHFRDLFAGKELASGHL